VGPNPEAIGFRAESSHHSPVGECWLPVQEDPGDMEVTRAWQVMSAIHNYIATHKDANGDVPSRSNSSRSTNRCVT